MKKELYVKPEIVVVELEPETVLAASVTFTTDQQGNETLGADAQGRRGEGWGSLWD